MYLVLTTSTGLATRVAVKPATSALLKWHKMPSRTSRELSSASFVTSYTTFTSLIIISY